MTRRTAVRSLTRSVTLAAELSPPRRLEEPCDSRTLIYMSMRRKEVRRFVMEEKANTRATLDVSGPLIDVAYFLILGDTFEHDVLQREQV